jgi:hypothetical protein
VRSISRNNRRRAARGEKLVLNSENTELQEVLQQELDTVEGQLSGFEKTRESNVDFYNKKYRDQVASFFDSSNPGSFMAGIRGVPFMSEIERFASSFQKTQRTINNLKYKRTILSNLLARGEVQVGHLKEQLQQEIGDWFIQEDFKAVVEEVKKSLT